MKIFVLLLISLLGNLTATSQSGTDTLSHAQKDSLIALLPKINTELKDYDLLKQKMYIHLETIQALQEQSKAHQQINTRKEMKLDKYATTVINLQTQNFTLTNQLKKVKTKNLIATIENWLWRGGALFLAGKLLKLY